MVASHERCPPAGALPTAATRGAAFAFGAALAALPAQQSGPTGRGGDVQALLRGPNGQPVAGAEAFFAPAWHPELPAIASWRQAPALRRAVSDAAGHLRVPGVEAGARGTLLCTTDTGLGGIAADVVPGEAVRIDLAPMAELRAVDDHGAPLPFVCHPAAVFATGERALLPAAAGERVRLPAGVWEIWAEHAGAWTWQRLHLSGSSSVAIELAGNGTALVRQAGAAVHPTDWPAVALLGDGRERCTLLGAAAAAPLTSWMPRTGAVIDAQVVPQPAATPLPWPPAPGVGETFASRVSRDGAPAARAEVWSLRHTDRDGWHLLAHAVAGADGTFALPRPVGGDDALLVTSEDAAPWTASWSDLRDGTPIALATGRPLRIACRSPHGEPLAQVRLEFEPDRGPAARQCARSDSRGNAVFPRVDGSGTLRVVDARLANQDVVLQPLPRDPLTLTLAAGETLAGRVLREGRPAAGVLVTLRDPTDRLRPRERTAITDGDGAFAFAGLDDRPDLVLFCSQQREGRTWSARREGLRGGGDACELTLRSEDPELGPPRGR